MTDQILGPLVLGDEIKTELRRRKRKDIYKTVSGASRTIITEKVRLAEAEGWRVARRNSKSTRMAQAKPADEQLEDEVWSVLAQMGFKEMSQGRKFTIAVGDGLPPRQIDVFAKDDETAIIAECTRRDSPARKSMSQLIEKIQAIREDLPNAIQKKYDQPVKLKVGFLIATRNISWSEVDLNRCREAKITVVTDGELDYYAALTQQIGRAARFQLLGHIFAGQKIEGLARQVVATRGKMGGETFYTFLIPPDELLKIAYVGHKASRDIDNLETYQRLLKSSRLKKIAKYINEGGKFATNIVVNLKTVKRTKLNFDLKESYGDEALVMLHLPPNYASAWVIDGQHRLYGYAYARESGEFNQDSSVLPVLAFENLSADKEMNLFIDINSKQVKVSTGLLVELYSDLHWDSGDTEEAFQALLSRIASRLNSESTSPTHNRMVVTGKKKTQFRCLTQTSIRDGLRFAKLLGTHTHDAVVPGPLSTGNGSAYKANLNKSLSVLSESLRLFSSEELTNHWNIGDGPGGYLCTNNGIRALLHVIKDVADHIRQESGAELYSFSADETFAELKPYLQVLVDYFKNASVQEIQAFRRMGSSLTAVRQQAYGMEAQINQKYPEFAPLGLRDYLESRDAAGTEEAAGKVTKVHKRLFDFVIGRLKTKFGTENKAWWTKGIPVDIRKKCSANWEEKNREGEEESHLYLIDYIAICHANWDLVKDEISLGARDKENKKANTKWIKDFNEIRNVTAHPERGVLSKEQVKDVNEIYQKVERYIPMET